MSFSMLLVDVRNVKYELQRRYVALMSSYVLELVRILQTLVVTVSNLPFTSFSFAQILHCKDRSFLTNTMY